MASEKLFETIPAFPDDIPTASMDTISLAKLNSGDQSTAQSLLDSCQKLGFFLLDLRGDALGESMINEIDSLFIAGNDIMNLPNEVKIKFEHDFPKSSLG